MKTTLNISDDLHQTLKQIAFNAKKTVTELILKAIEETYLSPRGDALPQPFAKLKGMWKNEAHSQKEIAALKALWKPK